MKISPRLLNGKIRDRLYGRLPSNIKEAIRWIAHKEKQSISWTIEQVVIEYFHLEEPEYVEQKNVNKVRKTVSRKRNFRVKKSA